MLSKMKFSLFALCGFLSVSAYSYADGGISLGATRVIYPEGAEQTSLPVSNSSNSQRFLINSWVENSQGKKDESFIATPPLFVSEPGTENTLRIMYVGKPLPKNKESIFYLNVKAIPSLDKDNIAGKNILQLAILSRIKLFVRPNDLPYLQHEAPAKLIFSHSGESTTVVNPTPYYITMVNITVGGKKVSNEMIAPMSSDTLSASGDNVKFESINDYGALDKPIISKVK
ncbi:fimbria/pilus periplasmic chaperone [Tatumella sp. UCD-D_suzukii]|uniref:fimbria/pilus periplasmic chaperone n=1 Tax=Tatumella sp. UCD-D_suzukii TaxID=1408192 RepID=UPI0004700E60